VYDMMFDYSPFENRHVLQLWTTCITRVRFWVTICKRRSLSDSDCTAALEGEVQKGINGLGPTSHIQSTNTRNVRFESTFMFFSCFIQT